MKDRSMSQSCRKRRRRRPRPSALAAAAAILCAAPCWTATHGLDYSSYLSAFREPDPPPTDEAPPATTSKEIKYGSKNAGAWPSTSTTSAHTHTDDDAIPKVVLRPRTRLKLQEQQAAAAAAAHKNNKRHPYPAVAPSISLNRKTAPIPMQARPAVQKEDMAAPAPAIQNHHAYNNAAHQRATAAATKGGTSTRPTSSHTSSSSILRDSNTKDTLINSSAAALPNKEAEDRRQLELVEMQREELEFMEWCRTELGIDTVLEIQWFEYDQSAAANHNWEDDILETTESSSPTGGDESAADSAASQKISIRGLAAGRDILEGETVIRIPVKALHSVATTIDKDPVLSQILRGDPSRWTTTTTTTISSNEEQDPQFYELPLLAVALLHHRRLGAASPIAPYVRLLMRTPVWEQLPFLWSAARIRRRGSEGVRQVARGIRDEVRGMYEGVVQGLIAEHPDLLGPEVAVDEHGVWMFSYEMFQWAFAIVNSRHWQLPIDDLATTTWNTATTAAAATTPHAAASVHEDQQVPPASVPTESWVLEHGDVDDDFAEPRAPDERQRTTVATSPHSFLAPVADLLNFGPPCTRVQYDAKQHAFEVIATCSFHKGEEVTFWYSNECDDVMMGVYGFSHPLIQPCRTNEEWRLYAADLEEELQAADNDLELLEGQLDMLEAILADCDCCDEEGGGEPKLRHEQRSSRRSSKGSNDRQQRIRRTFSRKSEF